MLGAKGQSIRSGVSVDFSEIQALSKIESQRSNPVLPRLADNRHRRGEGSECVRAPVCLPGPRDASTGPHRGATAAATHRGKQHGSPPHFRADFSFAGWISQLSVVLTTCIQKREICVGSRLPSFQPAVAWSHFFGSLTAQFTLQNCTAETSCSFYSGQEAEKDKRAFNPSTREAEAGGSL